MVRPVTRGRSIVALAGERQQAAGRFPLRLGYGAVQWLVQPLDPWGGRLAC
jgi:hypothetical protein